MSLYALFLAANGLIVWPHYSSAVTAINLIPVTLALLLIGDHLHKRSVRPRIFAVSFIAAAVYVLVSLNAIPSTGLAATRIGMNVVAVTVVLLLLVYGLRRTSARAVFVFLSLIAVALSNAAGRKDRSPRSISPIRPNSERDKRYSRLLHALKKSVAKSAVNSEVELFQKKVP